MKRQTFLITTAFIAAGLLSCNSNSENAAVTADTIKSATISEAANDTGEVKSYMDLTTSKSIKVKKNKETGKFINTETNSPVDFYYDPATNDTFDVNGRVVNMAISKDNSGKYMVDEARIKIQGDGDAKITSADGDTKIKIETNGDAKIKTDSSKIKIRNGEVKVKN